MFSMSKRCLIVIEIINRFIGRPSTRAVHSTPTVKQEDLGLDAGSL